MHNFSIITVVKNNPRGLDRTLASIFSQKDISIQSIVIDGKSEDHTLKICNKYPDVDVLVSENDTGIYDAMNKGLHYANQEWVLFLNADDVFYNENTLNDIVQFLNTNDDADIICGNTIEIFHAQKKIYHTKHTSEMPMHMPACHQSILIKTNILKQYLFNDSYRICGDLDLMARLIQKNHSVLYYPNIIACVDGVGASNKQWKITMSERKKIQQEYYPEKHIALTRYHRKVMYKRFFRSLLPTPLQLMIRKILGMVQ